MARLILISFILTFSIGSRGQQGVDTLMNNTQISLLTCDPGSEIYSLFGHSAVRVKNEEKNFDVVFNYGTFDFQTPNFTLKFMRGKLPYRLAVASYGSFLKEYHYFKRGVREQVLQINNTQKEDIIRFLENNAKPENAEYKYDFFYDNCSSRIRDVFEKTLHYPPQYSGENKLTFRNLLHRYLEAWPWLRTGIDIIIGSKADKIADASAQMFIPDKLHDNLASAQFNGRNLLGDTYDVLIFERTEASFLITPRLINFLLLLVIAFLYYKRKFNWLDVMFKLWLAFAITAMLLIVFLWFFTDHKATKINYNLLWLSPFYLGFLTKNNKVKWVISIFLIVIFILCYLNEFVGLIPQKMPVANFIWSLALLEYQRRKSGSSEITAV